MALELKKAQRSKAYLKLGISAPSGGGKTLGALLIAYGLMKEKYPNLSDSEIWAKVVLIDTENGSGELYVGRDIAGLIIGQYNAITLTSPFTAQSYIDAVNLAEDAKMEVTIIDSSSHLWTGQGGLLEQQGNITKRTGNSYTAWRDITPLHNQFVEKMLQTPMHIIATMRAKQEYVQEKNENGKTTVRKLGLEPEQRKGMEYEFTVFLEVNNEHEAFGSKDRTSIFDQKTFKINATVGRDLMRWLEGGTDEKPVVLATSHKADKVLSMASMKTDVVERIKALGGRANDELMNLVKKYTPNGNTNSNSIEDELKLSELRSELIEMQKAAEKVQEEDLQSI